MVKRETHFRFIPKAGEPFNVILSIQYRGYKGNGFKKVSFSSRADVQNAIRMLRLESDLLGMGLPKLHGANCVFKSSLNYPLTLEVLFPDCELGQVRPRA